MTQRNPMNERYQNTNDKKTGKTRRSAASAKPATKAASSVRIEGGKEPKPRGRFAKAQRQAQAPRSKQPVDRNFQPDTDEFRKWRRIWWVFIIIALALTSLSFFAAGWFPTRTPMYVMLAGGYAALIVAVVIDVVKVRKIRNAEAAKRASSKMSKKERKAQEEREARAKAEEEAKRAAKAEKKSRGLFGKKKESEDSSSGEGA